MSCSRWHQHAQFRHWEPAFGACCRIPRPVLLVLGTKVSHRKHKWSSEKRTSRLIRGVDPTLQQEMLTRYIFRSANPFQKCQQQKEN